MKRDPESGFTMVELLIVAAILVAMLGAVLSASDTVTKTATANARSAEVTATVRGALRKIGSFVRSAKMSTIVMPAVQADVTAARATFVGEWISPTDLIQRPGLGFQSASGLLSMNAALSTLPRELTFQLEKGELANGLDDDGDGLVDEGEILLMHDSFTVAVVRNIVDFSFMLDGRMLRVRVRCGKSDPSGRNPVEAQLEQSFYLRNN